MQHGWAFNLMTYDLPLQLDLNMSHSSRSIGTLPIVRLKKSSSTYLELMFLMHGSAKRSFPKRTLWIGCLARVTSFRTNWDSSCKASTFWHSLSPRASVLKMKRDITKNARTQNMWRVPDNHLTETATPFCQNEIVNLVLLKVRITPAHIAFIRCHLTTMWFVLKK